MNAVSWSFHMPRWIYITLSRNRSLSCKHPHHRNWRESWWNSTRISSVSSQMLSTISTTQPMSSTTTSSWPTSLSARQILVSWLISGLPVPTQNSRLCWASARNGTPETSCTWLQNSMTCASCQKNRSRPLTRNSYKTKKPLISLTWVWFCMNRYSRPNQSVITSENRILISNTTFYQRNKQSRKWYMTTPTKERFVKSWKR